MDKNPASDVVVEKSFDLAKFLLAFGRIDRVAKHEDGTTWESDTDHTVMLGVMACAFAKEYAPHLDTGKIAEFALVHDLVEVYAGDTMSFRIASQQDKDEKAAREHAAAERIREEFGPVFPWLPDTIGKYEKLDTQEACFVKFFDKILPKMTHILNGGTVVRDLGHTEESTRAFHKDQIASITAGYGKGHKEVEALYRAIAERMHTAFSYVEPKA
jgi:5'-deoxynucleotidase YfbR-like HD superfamily hydrolase